MQRRGFDSVCMNLMSAAMIVLTVLLAILMPGPFEPLLLAARGDKVRMSKELRSLLADIDDLRQPNFMKFSVTEKRRRLQALDAAVGKFAAAGLDAGKWAGFRGRIALQEQLTQSSAGAADEKAWQLLSADLWREATAVVGFSAAPAATADRRKGERLYQAHCAECHGNEGRGDGALSGKLKHAMSSFRKERALADDTPLKFFTHVSVGRKERGMPAFDGILRPEEIWDLAFLLQAWRHDCGGSGPAGGSTEADAALTAPLSISLKELAAETDEVLIAGARRRGERNDAGALKQLRCSAPFDPAVRRE